MSEEEQRMSKLDGTDVMLVFDEAYTENIEQQVFIIERVTD